MNEADQESLPVLDIQGHCATIRFNRPRKRNSLGYDDLEALLQHFDRVESDPSVRVLVITGTGRVFSAGLDLGVISRRLNSSDGTPQQKGPSFESVANRLEDLGVPTICRINGGVYGGAIDLALCCDFRIGVDTADMFMPQARLGIHYYRTGIQRFVTRLGLNAAKMLILSASKIDAAEMVKIGYLTSAVAADELDQKVAALADAIAMNAPIAMLGMKRTMNEFVRGELDDAVADARHKASSEGAEIREGMAAFSEKRAPRF